ncbi:MAG: pyridoxal 5'-phosphate synthase glutaminase subunit PdxT [Methanomicrobiales archaeon]|nr:pyridoxal 5'-phosphate synthase glutaminase subunit PdxT [Methanomicrobiales archaeon]
MPFHQNRCCRPVAGNGPIGVLALQGNVSEHIEAFESAVNNLGLGIPVIPVKRADEIPGLLALAIPGGESTTIMRLIDQNGMRETIQTFPGGIFATCAGMVIAARELTGETRFTPLDLVDITVNRNAFGRQRESFESDLAIEGMNPPFHAIFIRAPVITRAGPDVCVLATIKQGIVAVRSGKKLILSFHPEISNDLRMHQYFLTEVL